MKRSQRIQAIVDIKAQQANKALSAISEQQDKIQAARQQLTHLQQYRQDYVDQDARKEAKRLNAFLALRSFIAKLDLAINGQEDAVAQLELELMRRRQHWESLHQHSQNLQKVCDGLVSTELKAADKREQREADDRVAQLFRQSSRGA